MYRLGHTGVLEQVTTDHTRGEQLRRLGLLAHDAPPCAADSVVTSRLAHGPIGTALVPVELTRRLLLRSDGVGKQLNATVIGLDLDTADNAAEAADWLAADAETDWSSVHGTGMDAAGMDSASADGADAQHSYSDNITAVVLDLAQRPTGRHW